MAKRRYDPAQGDLFSGPAPAPVLPPPSPRSLGPRAEILAQVARDEETLTMDPVYWEPSREFYEERIKAYRDYADEMMPD